MLQVNFSQSIISRLVSRHRTTDRVCDRPRSGAPPVKDHNHDQYLRIYALKHGLAYTTQLQTHLPDVRVQGFPDKPLTSFDLNVGDSTDTNRQWEQDHKTWTMDQRSTVLLIDECRFILHRNDGLLQHSPKGSFGATVWAGITNQSKTNLVRVDGLVRTSFYLRDVIEPSSSSYSTSPIDGNVPPHSMTSNLNTIEHVWDQQEQRLDDLSSETPQNNIMRLVRNMRRHCQAVIVANSGNTYH
uniref:Uncharacterized protein n=1 Tax=Oryzias melastigma TaxID=30732 RepID=A0A3B3DL68_ORYME